LSFANEIFEFDILDFDIKYSVEYKHDSTYKNILRIKINAEKLWYEEKTINFKILYV